MYIILHSSEGLALSLFKKAKELNMTSPSYVWICGNDITDLLNSTLPPEFIANNMQGVVGIKSYINESAEYQEFFTNFENMFVSDYGKNNGNVYRPGAYAVRAYDALHAVSLAAKESKMRNISLAEALSLVNFEGLSGTIMPKNSTLDNKEMKYSDYLIFGIAGGDSIRLGYWHEGFGFNPDIKNLTWFHGLIEKNATNPSGLRTLKVGIPAKPFWKNFVNVETNSTINCSAVVDPSSVTGFCIDVFTEALNFLKYNISYQFVAYTTESNSSCKVRTYNDLANLVQSQEVDLVVGDVTIIAERSKNVSFTQPFLTSELVMLILQKGTHIGWLSLKPFSRDLWICISVIIFWFIVLVWYLERNDAAADEDFRDPERWKHWAASVWLLCNSIFLKIDQGVGSYHAKLVLLLWFLLVQVLLSSFTASLSSILVAEKVSPNIDNVKVGYNAASFVHDYLLSTFNYKPENLVPINRSEDFPTAFENGIINAAYLELPYLRVYLSEHSNYATSGESRTLGGFGFVSSLNFDCYMKYYTTMQ
ncbi:Glutamate receptor [Rhynchospora pubera]|uniref:Glutamate receptor n=1 Tax=Rhynchospora pubera TaxID=906938 RepID=A0AAV8C687_9POAL|nr:Glutamate receptor [Rhynchospora pubera]